MPGRGRGRGKRSTVLAPPVWADATKATTATVSGTPLYMDWSAVVASRSGKVSKVRLRVAEYGGAPTDVRAAIYSAAGARLATGTVTVSGAGYVEVTLTPTVTVTKGTTYHIARQAASDLLYTFNNGAATGGFQAGNTYANGLPATLPASWDAGVNTSGMYIA